jgi:hypothetical protein
MGFGFGWKAKKSNKFLQYHEPIAIYKSWGKGALECSAAL